MTPLDAFPGGADEARAFIESARLFVLGGGPGTTMAKQMSAVFDLAIVHLDSLAADPEREASIVTKPAYVDLWVAINEIVAASGGNPACMNVLRQRSVVKVNAALRALLRPAPPSPSAVADQIVRDVAELPDRDSPEDWPEAMLVTGDELRAIVLAALAASNANARGGDDV